MRDGSRPAVVQACVQRRCAVQQDAMLAEGQQETGRRPLPNARLWGCNRPVKSMTQNSKEAAHVTLQNT